MRDRGGRLRMRVLLMAALMLLVGAAVPVQAAGSVNDIGQWDGAGTCPSVVLLGARGSGGQDGLMGPQVNAVYYAMVARLMGEAPNGSFTVAWMPVPYPAYGSLPAMVEMAVTRGETAAYAVSRNIGAAMIVSMVADITKKCGFRTMIVLAGYSQGADAVSLAVTLPELQRSQVVGAVMVANPYLHNWDGSKSIGQPASEQSGGRLGRRAVPEWIRSRTVNACAAGDAVCDRDASVIAGNYFNVHTAAAYWNFAGDAGRWIGSKIAPDLAKGISTLVIDDAVLSGPTRWLHRVTSTSNGYQSDYTWTYSAAGRSKATNSAEWRFSVVPGQYKVSAYIPGSDAGAGVVYDIYDGSTRVASKSVAQANHFGFVTLGTWDFGSTTVTIRILDNRGSGPNGAKIGIDAVQLIRLR